MFVADARSAQNRTLPPSHVVWHVVNNLHVRLCVHLRQCDPLCMWREWSKKVPSDRLFFYARQFFPENGTFFNILRGHIKEVTCTFFIVASSSFVTLTCLLRSPCRLQLSALKRLAPM